MELLNVGGLDPAQGTDGQGPVIQGGRFVIGDLGQPLEVRDASGGAVLQVSIITFEGPATVSVGATGEAVVTIAAARPREPLMASGITPAEPLTTSDGSDWLYGEALS